MNNTTPDRKYWRCNLCCNQCETNTLRYKPEQCAVFRGSGCNWQPIATPTAAKETVRADNAESLAEKWRRRFESCRSELQSWRQRYKNLRREQILAAAATTPEQK